MRDCACTKLPTPSKQSNVAHVTTLDAIQSSNLYAPGGRHDPGDRPADLALTAEDPHRTRGPRDRSGIPRCRLLRQSRAVRSTHRNERQVMSAVIGSTNYTRIRSRRTSCGHLQAPLLSSDAGHNKLSASSIWYAVAYPDLTFHSAVCPATTQYPNSTTRRLL
jgi:hypothetical protein